MPETMAARIETLRGLPLPALRERYREAFGKEASSHNRDQLWRQVAWRIQEQELGGLSPGAQQKLEELKASMPSPAQLTSVPGGGRKDRRVPSPGTLLQRPYKGQMVEVRVTQDGFEHHGKVFRSLTAVAKEVTGAHWNGFLFFNL